MVSRLIQVLGERILGSYNRVSTPLSSFPQSCIDVTGWFMWCFFDLISYPNIDAKKHMVSNLSTVAVVPITRDVPLDNFTKHLCAAVNTIGNIHKSARVKVMMHVVTSIQHLHSD